MRVPGLTSLSPAAFMFVALLSSGWGGSDWVGDDGPSADAETDIVTAFDTADEPVDPDVGVSDTNGADVVQPSDSGEYQEEDADSGPGAFFVTSLDPSTGGAGLSTTVTITGAGLDGAVDVWFGRARSPDVFPISGALLSCIAPPGAAGAVDVRVVDTESAEVTGGESLECRNCAPEDLPEAVRIVAAALVGGAT